MKLSIRWRRADEPAEASPAGHHMETPDATGAPDRFRTLKDSELDLPRVVEGACAHYHGKPLEANPWPREYGQFFQAWRYGWVNAAYYREMWQAEESKRWLTDEVPA